MDQKIIFGRNLHVGRIYLYLWQYRQSGSHTAGEENEPVDEFTPCERCMRILIVEVDDPLVHGQLFFGS